MYIYVSEIFPTEIRPIGMGFSLFGQFAGKSLNENWRRTVLRIGKQPSFYSKPRLWGS